VIAIEQFGMSVDQNGMMLSFIGAISLFMQGVGIATLTKRFGDNILMAFATSTLTISYVVLVSLKKLVSDPIFMLNSVLCFLFLLVKDNQNLKQYFSPSDFD
jgi:hypothetical protein